MSYVEDVGESIFGDFPALGYVRNWDYHAVDGFQVNKLSITGRDDLVGKYLIGDCRIHGYEDTGVGAYHQSIFRCRGKSSDCNNEYR